VEGYPHILFVAVDIQMLTRKCEISSGIIACICIYALVILYFLSSYTRENNAHASQDFTVKNLPEKQLSGLLNVELYRDILVRVKYIRNIVMNKEGYVYGIEWM